MSKKPVNISPLVISYKIAYGLHRTFNTDFSFFNYKNNLTFHGHQLNNSLHLTTFLKNYIFKVFFYKSQQTKINFEKSHDIMKQSLTKDYFAGNKVISEEITSLVPVFFNCPYFSYNLIQKLDQTFMVDHNFLRLMNNISINNIDKLILFSKKIEIKNQFFTSKNNKFLSSDCFGKTSSYSSFEGEMIYKKDLKSKKTKASKSFSRTKSAFLMKNANNALILTKEDLISFSLGKTKKQVKKIKNNNILLESTTLQEKKKIINKLDKKQYYINDIIIKCRKINQLPSDQSDHPIETAYQVDSIPVKAVYKVSKIPAGLPFQMNRLYLGEVFMYGDKLNNHLAIFNTGQIIHISQEKITLRKGQPIFISPKAILHKLSGDLVNTNSPVITLAYSQLKTGDIVQGIPKVEQFFEARTTKRGRLFKDSLPQILKTEFENYKATNHLEIAVRLSFSKIQQIIIDGVQAVYRAQGASIADKHLEVIVKQMTSKVKISNPGRTGLYRGEIIDLDFVERVNNMEKVYIKKLENTAYTKKFYPLKTLDGLAEYEPLVLGITRASLEVDSFLSAASFQQTTRVLSKAAIGRKKDFLQGLKENVILGNLIPAGTGYLVSLESPSNFSILEKWELMPQLR